MEKTTKMTANEVVQYLKNIDRYRVYLDHDYEEECYRIESDTSSRGDFVLYSDIELLIDKMIGD
jgi:hypothetical protein